MMNMQRIFQRFFAAPRRVLVVDPDRMATLALRHAIESEFQVRMVATAAEALSQLAHFQPDLVITELDLPDRSGMELLRVGLAHGQSTPSTQVSWIIATSHRTVSDKVTAFQAGAADYLVKPLQLDLLSSHLVNLYRHRNVINRVFYS